MVKKKKIPMRMCLGCQEMRPKKELIRVVRTPDDIIEIDAGGKRSGRGAYICPTKECLLKAVKGKRMEKAFGRTVPQEVVETLKERLVNSGAQRI
ncbi:RNase P modulator RnpM [Phosphitispora sp. TUW77]|uniref:RNase P modulator RnpM n=1 Tax=Phosphitispora sp. TUW77 TaxID=3152361 RepID=UPI003AB85A18